MQIELSSNMDDIPDLNLNSGEAVKPNPWYLDAPFLLDILSVTSDAVLVTNSDQHIVFFNAAAEQVFGYPAEDVIGQPLDLVIPPNYVSGHYGHVLDFMAAGEKIRKRDERILVRGYRKDGSSFPADVSLLKFGSGDQLAFTALVRDVSEQQLAEDALNESETVYRSVITALEEGVLIHSQDGTIGACNPSAERILGMQADELTRLSSLDPAFRPIHEDGSPFPGQTHPAEMTLQEGRSQSGVVMGIHRPDGELVWLSMNSSPIYMHNNTQPMAVVVSFSDITSRKNTLDALRQSEERFYKAFNSSPAAISIRSEATGEYLEINQSFIQLLGFERQEIIGRTPGELGVWTGTTSYNQMMEFLKQEGTVHNLEIDIRTKTGEIRNCLVSAEIIELQGEAAVLAMVSDFTERRQFEQALSASEARFRGLFEQSQLPIHLAAPDGRTIAVNQAYQDLWGLAGADLANHNVFERSAIVQTGVIPYLKKAFAGQVTVTPAILFQPDIIPTIQGGRSHWIKSFMYPIKDEHRQLREMATVFEDVTEQIQAEQSLIEKEAQYRSIFESVSDGLFITNLDGELVDFNPAASQMNGYSMEEFRQLQPKDFIHPDSFPKFIRYITSVKADRPFRTQAKCIHKAGSLIDVDVFGTLFNFRGKPHALTVVRDITEQVQAYQLLERRVSNRTRELSTLLKVSRNVASTLELKPLLALILDQIKEVVDFTASAIFVLEDDEKLALLSYQRPASQEPLPNFLDLRRAHHCQVVIEQCEPVIISNIQADTPLARSLQQTSQMHQAESLETMGAWMGIPLLVKELPIGMLAFEHQQVDFFTERHAELALTFANFAAVAIENARLYEQAQTLASLQERQRLARELHDSVSQALYGIALGARTARTLLDRSGAGDQSALAEPLDYVLSLAEAGLAEMRALIFELRPESLELEGLSIALSKQAAALAARHTIRVETFLCEEPQTSLTVKEAFYRIAQEALNNIVKHAAASEVRLTLNCTAAELLLIVEDNGQGFDPGGDFPGHLGLRSMSERIERVGGNLIVESSPGKGARVSARLIH
jgi:PAS domain S-box-containing protein